MMDKARIIYLISTWIAAAALLVLVFSAIIYPVSDVYLKTFAIIAIIAGIVAVVCFAKGRSKA